MGARGLLQRAARTLLFLISFLLGLIPAMHAETPILPLLGGGVSENPPICAETVASDARKLSIVPALAISKSNFSISAAKNRSFRSNSSHLLTYDTYRRWNGVKSGFNYNCILGLFFSD